MDSEVIARQAAQARWGKKGKEVQMEASREQFAALERRLAQAHTQMLSQLARIAHATEAMARKLDPDFKTVGETDREMRRSRLSGKPEASE